MAGRQKLIADANILRPLFHLFNEFIIDFCRNQHAGSRFTDLARVEERSESRAVHRKIHIGVIQDDVGRFSAQFQGDLLHRIGGHFHDFPADFGAARKGDFVNIGMGAENLAQFSARSGRYIDDALGNACGLCAFGNDQGRTAALGGRFQDNGFP